jgi:mono/diheme cytochrome c family protein
MSQQRLRRSSLCAGSAVAAVAAVATLAAGLALAGPQAAAAQHLAEPAAAASGLLPVQASAGPVEQAGLTGNGGSGGGGDADPATLMRGWSVLRAVDCARCHGRDWRGSSGPDLVDAVRAGPRERFEHFVLVGDIVRGMPGYRSQALVVAELDAIYAYLRARADGRIGPGAPPGER